MDTEARLAIFAIVEQNHGSMCRLTRVIPSVSIKDRTVVGTSVEIERMPLT